MEIGVQIRALRKQKGISQDILAKHLGVTYQAVSKWENGSTMPDIAMLPSIARYFGVSIDYLLEFDLFASNNEVKKICRKAFAYRKRDLAQAEVVLREGLKRYPNDEIILNHLLYILMDRGKFDETILLAKMLIDITHDDEVKYDAYRILLETYKKQGSYSLLREELNAIPELYFTKLELIANLLDGAEAFEAALDQKFQSLALAVEMLLIVVKCLISEGETDIAKRQLEMANRIFELMSSDELVPKAPLFELEDLRDYILEVESLLLTS